MADRVLLGKKALLQVILGVVFMAGTGWYLFREFSSKPLTEGSEMLVTLSPHELKETIVAASNRLTLVNVWATWCPPCVEELPLLAQLREKYLPRGVEVVLYSADKNRQDATQLLQSIPITFKNYSIGTSSLNDLGELYPQWPGSLPVSIIFDSSGEVVEKWLGTVSMNEFEQLLDKHLSAETQAMKKGFADENLHQ